MSIVNKPTSSSVTAGRAGGKPSANAANQGTQHFLFDKENYMWMLGGIALILIGFMLMSGGKSANPNEFHYDEIYSFRRITLAPIVVLLGFAIEVYAIMKKPKDANKQEEMSKIVSE
jgi:hypothetical protein